MSVGNGNSIQNVSKVSPVTKKVSFADVVRGTPKYIRGNKIEHKSTTSNEELHLIKLK